MGNNAELLQRAKRMRQLHRQSGMEKPQQAMKENHAPAHVSNHASYTALMRSHDRMRSRHMSGQG